jgi:hypothetical protein
MGLQATTSYCDESKKDSQNGKRRKNDANEKVGSLLVNVEKSQRHLGGRTGQYAWVVVLLLIAYLVQ